MPIPTETPEDDLSTPDAVRAEGEPSPYDRARQDSLDGLSEVAEALGLTRDASPFEVIARAREINRKRRGDAPPASGGTRRFRNGSNELVRVVWRDENNRERSIEVPAGEDRPLPADVARIAKDIAPQLTPLD